MWFYIDKLVIVQKFQFPVDQFPQAVILPFLHTFPVHKLAEREMEQVYIYLDFKTAVFRGAVGNPYFFQVGKIHAVLVIFLKTEILDQPFCFLHIRTVRLLCCFRLRFFPVNSIFFRLRQCVRTFFLQACLRYVFRDVPLFQMVLPRLLHTFPDKRDRFLPENRKPSLHIQIFQADTPVFIVNAVNLHMPPVNGQLHPQRDIVGNVPLFHDLIRCMFPPLRVRSGNHHALAMFQKVF